LGFVTAIWCGRGATHLAGRTRATGTTRVSHAVVGDFARTPRHDRGGQWTSGCAGKGRRINEAAVRLAGIDTNLVLSLHALLRERNVTRAARALGVGQSAASSALARLRAHFDDPLLVRVGRSYVLTERASALLAPVETAVAELERVFAPPQPFDPKTSRRVFRIAATDNLELYLLPQLVRILAKEAPLLDLRFHHLPKDWELALTRGDVDLKLGRKSKLPKGLRDEDLLRDHLTCVVRSGHPVKRRLTLPVYAGLSHILISPGESGRGIVDEAVERLGFRRRIVITLPHFTVAPFVVAASDLTLTVPARLLASIGPALRLRELPLPLALAPYTMTQVWAERQQRDEGHCWMRDAIQRALA